MGLAVLAVYKGDSSSTYKHIQHQQTSTVYLADSGFCKPLMMVVYLTVALLALTCPSVAFDMGQSTRCVTIPNQMKVCKDVGYSEMRLPNFLGHSSLESEVVPRSEDWRPLLQTGCHPQAQAFLCSLIAPVCLDT